MNKINTYAIFGIMFLGATLLASGMYSNQIFALNGEQNGFNHKKSPHDDVNGSLNEAEINADIEQENKCKKDTECENENEINNLLNITTITTGTGAANGDGNGQSPDQEQCLFCLSTDNGSPFDHPGGNDKWNQLKQYLEDPNNTVQLGNNPDVDSIQELCETILEAAQTQQKITEDQLDAIFNSAWEEYDATLANNIVNCINAGEELIERTQP